MRATRFFATSSFDCVGHDSTPAALMSAPHCRRRPSRRLPPRRRSRRSSRSPCACSLALACSITFSVSAAKPTTSLRSLRSSSLAIVARMSGFSISASVRRSACVLLQLLLARRARRASRRPRRRTRRRRPAAPPRPRAACRARLSTRTVFTPGGSGRVTGPRHQRHVGAGRGRRARDRVALLAGRTVGDVAHRIDRLVRRARRDDDALSGERLARLPELAPRSRRRSPAARPCGRGPLRRSPPSRRRSGRP